jgi:hypothetical protein
MEKGSVENSEIIDLFEELKNEMRAHLNWKPRSSVVSTENRLKLAR